MKSPISSLPETGSQTVKMERGSICMASCFRTRQVTGPLVVLGWLLDDSDTASHATSHPPA